MYKHAQCTNKQGLQTKCTSRGPGQMRTNVVLVTSFFVKVRTKREGRAPKSGLFVCMYFIDSMSPKKHLVSAFCKKVFAEEKKM